LAILLIILPTVSAMLTASKNSWIERGVSCLKVNSDGYYIELFPLPNGRQVDVFALTYGRARIGLVNRHVRESYDDVW
jgi:hypothetical protein